MFSAWQEWAQQTLHNPHPDPRYKVGMAPWPRGGKCWEKQQKGKELGAWILHTRLSSPVTADCPQHFSPATGAFPALERKSLWLQGLAKGRGINSSDTWSFQHGFSKGQWWCGCTWPFPARICLSWPSFNCHGGGGWCLVPQNTRLGMGLGYMLWWGNLHIWIKVANYLVWIFFLGGG